MKTIGIYDLEDNLITILDSYRAVAKYFDTSVGVIKVHMCLKKKSYLLQGMVEMNLLS